MAGQETDRRRRQRVDARLKLAVQVPRPDGGLDQAHLETLNISSSGVYFESDHFIEPMTKLDLRMELPIPSDGAGGARTVSVRCEGIVVRVTPEAAAREVHRYEVAVFFTHFEPDALARLEEHIALLVGEA